MNDKNKEESIENVDLTPKAIKKLEDVKTAKPGEIENKIDELLKAAIKKRAGEIAPKNGPRNTNPTPEEKEMAKEDVGQYEARIRDGFKYAYYRSPEGVQKLRTRLENAKSFLQSGQMAAVVDVNDVVGKWSGDSKDAFKAYFLDPLIMPTISNQQILFDELTLALAGYESILRASRMDALDLAKDCIMLFEGDDGKSVDSIKYGLQAASVAVGVMAAAAAIPAGPIGAGVVFALVSSGISYSTLVNDTKGISNTTVTDILGKLIEGLDDLQYAMDDQERKIAEKLAETRGSIEGLVNSGNPATKATIVANEPSGEKNDETDVSGSRKPKKEEFHPRDDD